MLSLSTRRLSVALATAFALLASSATVKGQTVRAVSFADVAETTLDLLIAEDIAALGDDSTAHLVYELERGRPFFFSGQLEYEDVHLELRPQPGDGAPPIVLQILGDGAETVDQLIRMRGTARLTLRGLVLTGRTNQGTYNDRILRTSGEGNVVVMDSVFVDEVGQALIRINGEEEKIYIRNSAFNRLGRPSNPDNGRLFDNRSEALDSLVFENNVVTNVTSRFYRSSASDLTNHLRFDRNTFVGSGQHGFDIREGVREFAFTNNVVADAIFLGRDYEDHYDENGEPLDDARHVIAVDTLAPDASVTIANNNFFERASTLEALPAFERDEDTGGDGDSLTAITGFYLSENLRALVGATDGAGAGSSNFSEQLTFDVGPASYGPFIVAVAQDTSSGNEVPAAGAFDNAGLVVFADYSGQNFGSSDAIDRFVAGYDLCYDGDARSATAGPDGGPIGGQVAGCPELRASGIRVAAVDFAAEAFPNPTAGRLTLRLGTDEPARVDVLDAAGRLLSRRPAAATPLDVDLGDRPAGVYYLRVVTASGRTGVARVLRR